MLQILRKKIRKTNLDLVCASAMSLPFRSSSFRLLTCFGLTGYFRAQTQENFLSEISRIIAANGKVAVDFLRPYSKSSRQLRAEETADGNPVYLLKLRDVVKRVAAEFDVMGKKKTARQVQFLLEKKSGKD